MRMRLLLAVSGVLMLTACGESATSPTRLEPTGPARDEIACRSGYHIATRGDGSQYCAPDSELQTARSAKP